MKTLAAIAACTIAIMMPALLNGGPFLFLDSQQYFQVGQSIYGKVFEGRQADNQRSAPARQATPAANTASPKPHSAGESGMRTGGDVNDGGLAAIAGGRSPLYSFLFYFFSAKLSMWLMALLQAGLCGWLAVGTARTLWGSVDLGAVTLAVAPRRRCPRSASTPI
ncbi:MAG: hypothetical protein HC850_11340 [Rhodomicrobium sp.]|nr:hypothetical protein [Rhodomicrobium sp.]